MSHRARRRPIAAKEHSSMTVLMLGSELNPIDASCLFIEQRQTRM